VPKLARAGVEIFFTQVFRDGFFHADMHPGNVLVTDQGKYIALDFGIMGTLNETDKNYLAQQFPGLLPARLQESRPAPTSTPAGCRPDTRADEFEAAIRAVCEPVFDRPLKEIAFGKVLLRLFQTSRRFGMEIQPQLVMLQKTLLNIEGPRPPARPGTRPLVHRQALPGTLDERTDRLARLAAHDQGRSPVLGRRAAATAASGASGAAHRPPGETGKPASPSCWRSSRAATAGWRSSPCCWRCWWSRA
jgi:hypothetical protein